MSARTRDLPRRSCLSVPGSSEPMSGRLDNASAGSCRNGNAARKRGCHAGEMRVPEFHAEAFVSEALRPDDRSLLPLEDLGPAVEELGHVRTRIDEGSAPPSRTDSTSSCSAVMATRCARRSPGLGSRGGDFSSCFDRAGAWVQISVLG